MADEEGIEPGGGEMLAKLGLARGKVHCGKFISNGRKF
jgi:hypothetical protein